MTNRSNALTHSVLFAYLMASVLSTLSTLTDQIAQVHDRAQVVAVQQVNYWLTARNWLVGWYVVEYEQQGSDRATYGERLLGELARSLRARGGRSRGIPRSRNGPGRPGSRGVAQHRP